MYEIKKVIVGYAYPKNGNAHNPTPKVHYHVYRDGQLVIREFKLRDAKQFIQENTP
jgi:hypothetical protein